MIAGQEMDGLLLTFLHGFLAILFQSLDGNGFQSNSRCRIVLQHIPHVLTNHILSSASRIRQEIRLLIPCPMTLSSQAAYGGTQHMLAI